MPTPDEFASLNARSQKALIDFLEVELALGDTFLDTARIESKFDEDHCQRAFEKAQEALDSVRYFQGRVSDRTQWAAIQTRADRLEAALKAFRG